MIAIGSPWRHEPELVLDLFQAEAYLRSSHGFLVDSEDAREVGIVDEVEIDQRTGRVAALEVCGGWFSRRRHRIAVDDVVALYPHSRRIVVTNASVGRGRS